MTIAVTILIAITLLTMLIAHVGTDGNIQVLHPVSGQEFSIIDHITWNH